MAGRRKRGAVKDAVPEADAKNNEKQLEVKEEEMEVKEEPEDEENEEDLPIVEKVTKLRGRPRKPKEEVNKEERGEELKMEAEEEEEEATPVLRKARRAAATKPKQEVQDETEEELPLQAKRGRKQAVAKQNQELQDEEKVPQVRKGRKRAATKPKVEVQEEQEEGTPSEIKKGRKKTTAKPKLAAQDEEDETPPKVRKERKRAAAKPKQEVIIETEEEEEEAAPLIKKGKRGAAAKAKQLVQDVDEEEEEVALLPVKKGKKRVAAQLHPKDLNKGLGNATFVISKDEVEEEKSSTSSAGKKKTASTAKATGGKAKLKAPGRKAAGSKTKLTDGKENSDSSNIPKKSGVKTGAERVVVMKGRAAVDALCPIAQHSHVYEEEEDIWDCMLNQTNIQFNNNKFYLIQLLEDDSSKTYSVWMRWGRVGANGQVNLSPCGSDLDKAKNIFMKKFSDKTKNEWDLRFMFEKVPGKYDLLKMDYSKGQDTPDTGAVVKKAKTDAIECQLHPKVKAIIELICDVKCMEEAVVEMKYDANKAPLGKLTSDQIKAGYLALKHIDDLVESGKFAMKDLIQACNDFYTRVPHYFGMKVPPLIRTKTEIREKVDLLGALGDIQAALSVLDQPIDVDTHPTDQHYRSLKCDLTPLEKNSGEYKIIEQYMKTTHAKTHSQYTLELMDVLVCRKDSEYTRFKDVGNRMLLWHGSRISNWAGILSQGLRIAPPEAPSTGYMFGKGIYFADMASKSANYCWANASKNVAFLLLSEVALGKSNELFQANYEGNKLPKGCHSVKGCGRTAPQPQNFTKLSDGVIVPLGPGVPVTGKNIIYSLLYNEYIVYDPAQVRTRFLLKVKFNFK